MGAFGNAVRAMFKRPFILLFFAAVTLAGLLINYYNPVSAVISGISSFGVGDFFTSIVSFIQLVTGLLTDPAVLVKGGLILLGLLVLFAVLAGIILSGLLNTVNNALEGKPGEKGEFLRGVGKSFLRMSFASFWVGLLGFLFLLCMLVAAVPSVILTKTWTAGKPELMFPSVLLDVLTFFVLFFCCLYFRVYMFYWFPAKLYAGKGAFRLGKRTADLGFWRLAGGFIAFDIVFIAFRFLITRAGGFISSRVSGLLSVLLPSLVNWIFLTAFFTAFVFYVLASFKMGMQAQTAQNEK